MKRIFCTVLMLVSISIYTYGQELTKRDLHLGVSFSPQYDLYEVYDVFHTLGVTIPTIFIGADYSLTEAGPGRVTLGYNISVGLYSSANDDTFIAPNVGARATYSFSGLLDGQIEPYGGLAYNYYYMIGDEIPFIDDNDGQVSFLIGSRFLFSEKVGAFVELNPNNQLFKVGFVFKKKG